MGVSSLTEVLVAFAFAVCFGFVLSKYADAVVAVYLGASSLVIVIYRTHQ
jgi:hypothetical protein